MSGRARIVGLVAGLAMGSLAQGQNALDAGLDQRLDPRGPQSLWAGGAATQQAGSSGRLLDNSLYHGSRYNDAGISRDPMREFGFRRSIVTGNAPSGLSFRGDVGYSDPRAFRSDLGSNDLFAFRRDSLYSGLVGQGIRGTEALQYQMALTTGSTPPPNLVGSIVVPRSFTPEPVALDRSVPAREGVGLSRPDPSDESETGSLLGTLRSSSAYSTIMSLQPVMVNKMDTQGQGMDIGVTASPLRGVRLAPIPDESQDLRPDTRVDTSMPGTAFEDANRVETAHDVVMRQLEEAATGGEDEPGAAGQDLDWRQRLLELRNRLNRGDPPASDEKEDGDQAPTPGDGGSFDLDAMERLGAFDEQTLELMRKSREPIERLVSPGEAGTRDAFREHMESGQRLLTRERFFDAEERFTRALALQPGDVTAQVGRIHAQLGAGMYLSASMNLRVLIFQNPELVAMRFDEKLLPGKERREQIMSKLRAKAGIGAGADASAKGDPQLRRESGLLLAYLGRQSGDRVAVRDGLAAIRAVNDLYADDESQASERRLLDLLERVWLPAENDG